MVRHASWDMPRVERDPERGRAAAAKLKALGARESSLRQPSRVTSRSSHARCPNASATEELGGACYFEPVSDELSDWMPTHEHFRAPKRGGPPRRGQRHPRALPRSKREGGHRDVDNAILAHRLCNRIDYSVSVGRPSRDHARDLEERKREEATRRNHERSPTATARRLRRLPWVHGTLVALDFPIAQCPQRRLLAFDWDAASASAGAITQHHHHMISRSGDRSGSICQVSHPSKTASTAFANAARPFRTRGSTASTGLTYSVW